MNKINVFGSTEIRNVREGYWQSKLTTQSSISQQFHDEMFMKFCIGMRYENI